MNRSLRSEAGETLLELLIAMVIVGLAGGALLTGMGVITRNSTVHQGESVGDDTLRSYAEAIDQFVKNPAPVFIDGTTTSSPAQLVSNTAGFTSADVGVSVTGTPFPTGTTIFSVTNGTTVVLSQPPTAGTGLTFSLPNRSIRCASTYTPASINFTAPPGYDASAVVAWSSSTTTPPTFSTGAGCNDATLRLQQITLNVHSCKPGSTPPCAADGRDAETMTLVVRKR